MAERPLYTLYKNLKAQNYDVPDDYNKFESALTRDGKGGADNRHAIYENLKAQNFDVPDTYERFYSALFEPRSKTSSRAKGGSVPMTAADRARFSAGAQSISASAQQTMDNAGRYNRLKQRKQKQQKDFGRMNLGTHQTPYGGDANNVVKDDFAYNPETSKAGAYVTSDNENVYSQNDAEQKQAILDEQNNAYQQAVDTGEIPSAFDVRDKNGNYDLQENIGKNGTYLTEEGAQKQFDKKLADAYARKKEIEALIAEDNRQHGNPLLSYGASIGASNGRTAEQSDYRNKLATSLSLVTEQIGALEAVKQYPTSSWGEDALKALDNTAFTAKTWDFGLTDFATMGQMERIKTKMDNNIPLSGSDKMLLKSKLGADAAAALEDEKMGNIYRWTKIAGQSLPFMLDFFMTGGYGGITKGISRGALKFAAKRGMGKVSAAILKNTGIVAGDVIGSYAMAGTEQALKTGADIMQRHLGNLYQDEKGDYKFGTFDENGNLLHEGGESMGTALYKGLTSAMVENYTEKLFGHNYGIKKGAIAAMEKHGMNGTAQFFKNIGKSGWYTNSKKWMEKFGINGFGEEVMEEEIGIPLHALLDGDNKFSDLGDAKQQLDIIGGMAISVGSMYAMGAGSRPVKGIYNRAQYYRFRNKVNVADSDAQNLIGDNWADIKDKIDNATNEQMGGVLAGILRQRDTMTKEQINAAVNYGVNLMKMRGYNIAKTAEMNAREITNEPTTPEEQHQTDIDNAYSEGHDADDADKHDIQIQQEDQMKTLAAALGISEQQLSAMSDEELESLTGQNDKLDQAIYDYQLSSARYQGVVDDAQDKVDIAAHQAEQRVDMYTDQSRGSVRNATIKASGGLEDYGVYIISGNIATHEDGSIDVSNRDDMILYYDPTTNSVEHADALMFAELGEELPADDVKAQAVADAKENAIKEVAGIIDGTVEVGSQFNVTDADGSEHTYEVLADYGDGTAAISIDGNVVENPYSLADLQQMKDLEDQKRLEATKAEREQMEKERAEQQTQETEQTQPSFDFNQILNDNGNVVLVDVLDKDGNTKYPDSRLFLIRDAGAKAKVVELKSDGTIVPHAVNKEDVATISSMSLDEYKQAMPETSMIEDNSGVDRGGIEVESPTIEGETAAPESAETPATEQAPAAPAIALEDGTIVPMLEDGNPDFSKLTAAQTAELYDSQFGEDAESIVSGYVSDAKKALDKASNMTVKGKTFVEQKAAKDAKEKAIADAQAAYDSAIAIRDAYNERQLAKVEDTAEGRKNLIEKARRKFARLKSAVKDDAEAVAQLYKETVGTLLHRLYDGTGIDVTDTIPLTAEEYVASNLGAHSLNYEGTETSKGVKQETGLSREDFAKTQLLAADGKGTTIDALVHSLWENRPSNLDSLDTQDIRNAMLSVITSGFKASEARNYIENLRIAQAENFLDEQKKAADNAAFAEENKAETEQQTETAPASEEKTGEENSDEINDEENEKINEQTNENINAPEVPEDATTENPLGAQLDQTDLPFSAKENGTQQTTAERAADVEKNKVDDVKVVDNIVGQKTRKAFERLAKMMGASIQWQYSDKLGNGWIQETTDADGNVHRTIFITLDSSITEGAQFIFGHEMTHQIKNLNPAAYNELTHLVLDTYGSDAFDKAVDETMKRYSDAGFSGRARDYYAEEVVADAVGEMIRDLNLAHTLAMKMSHPLLAAIHEILQKIKLAFYGTEYSDVTKNIIRSIEQAYVKTANGEITNSETGEDVSFSLRQKPEPKKKGIGYKVFVLKDGKLYPPMVANPDGAATPVGVWLDADAAPIAGESKTGRPQVKQGGKGTQGGSGKLAYRPGWHLGVVPYAIQFNRKDAEGNKTLFPKNFVFAEVEYAADVDYQEEARQEGINPSGKYQHSLAGLKHLPTDGYYMYRTNPNPETDPWVITGAMKVNRILTRAEQADLVSKAGREPQQIQDGDIVTDDVVNSINQEIAAAPKFSLKKDGLTPEIANTLVNIVDADEEHGFKNYAEAREWAKKNIVRTYNDEETGGKGEINISNTAVGKYLSEKAIDKSISKDVHMSVLKVLPSVLRESVDAYQHGDRKKVNNVRSEKFGINPDVMIHRCFGAVNIGGKVYGVKITLKENVKTRENKKLYSYEATKIELLDGKNEGVTMTPSLNSNNSITVAKIAKVFETTKKNGEKVEVEEPKTFEEFLNHPSLKFSIKNEEQRKAAEDAYEYASKLRPNKYAQYALVDMSNPSNSPEYYEKKVLADRWRRFYNKAVHNELDDVYKDAWGNYKLFDLDRPFADQVNEVKGDVPSEFNAPDVTANKNADNESGAEYHEYKQGGLSSVTYEDRYKAFKQREANREKVAGLKKEQKETEDSYNLKGKERAEYHKQLMKEYMDKHKMTEEYEIPDDVWDDLRSKSFEKYQDELDSLFNKYKDLDRQIKAVAEPRFSLKDEKTLAGVHNITEEKLRKALKLGGFANPSLAVIDTNKSGHDNFGEISFIAPSALLDKRTGKTGGTWITDAYTQRYPSVEREMSEKGSQKFRDWVDSLEYPSEAKAEIKRQAEDALSNNNAPAWELMYLKEKGIDIKEYDSRIDYRWKEIIRDYPTADDILNSMQTDPELNEKVTSLAKHAIIHPTWEKVSLEVRRKMYEETGVKASPINPQVRKQTKEIFERDYAPSLLNKNGTPKKSDVKKVVEQMVKEHNDTKKYNFYLSKVKASNYVNKNGFYDDYIRWQENKLDEFGTKNRIFRGYTKDGSRKYVPETLENVSKAMREEADGQTNGSEYTSFGSFIAKLASRVDSTDEMRANKDKLSSNKDKEEFYEKWSEVYYDLAKFLYNDVFYGEQRLHDIVLQSDPKKYAKKEYGITLTPTFMKKLDALKNAVQTELKSAYFETKYNRPLRLNEFAAAVVPDNLGEDVRKGIEDAGLPMYDYDPNKEGDRSRAFNEAINSRDNIKFSLKSMMAKPEGWKQANKKAIHIAEAIERDPKFSLKNLDGTLIKAGTYFSGGGLVEEGLKGIIDPVVAVEYDEKISGVYRNNFGQHIVTADVRDVDPRELVKQIDGEVEYFHASPVCKNYSQAKSNHAEVELDKETAASTAEFINAIKPKVVTIENVKGYKDSDAMKTITDALDANGYTWDADVYNAADYGGYTNRERLIVRAVRDGKLPAKPKKMAHKSGWYEAVADIIPTLTEKKNGVANWMDIRLKADGIDWRNINKPLYVMGSAYADGKVPHAFADELLPTLRTKSGDVIVMPDGKVYRAMGRVLARVSGVSDDYKMPFSENLSHTIIGNGIPTQLTEHVIAPLLTGSDPKFSIRAYHGTGVSFDKFDLSHAFEGEGSETFGHGVYVTNSKKIGDNYAQRAKDRKGKFGFDYKIDMSADAGQMLSHYINKNQDVDKGLENARQDLKSALEMFPDDETLKELSAILQKNNNEIAEASNEAYLYDVDIPDDNGENYLGWNESQNFPLEKWYRLWEITHHGFNENEYFKDGGANYDKDRIERIIQMKLDSSENGMQKLPTLKGEELYHALEDFFDRERPLRGAKLASRALSEIGFVGIKYPAGMIHGGAEEGDYNYVIFDEDNANIVGNTKFSLRYDKFEHDLNQWKKDNNLPKDAQRPTIPQRNAGESAVDFLRRVDEYRKQMALWKTAPTYEQHLLSDDTALGEFNRELQRGSVLKRIAFQDSMLAIRKAQEAIMKEVGVDRLNMAEDAYTAENRSHGKGKNEFEEYNSEFLQPLRKAYHQMKKVLGDSYDNVRIYMMAKHGLERDAQMAFKKSLEADYEDVAQRSAAYKAYKGDMNRIINDSDLEFGRVDFTTWRQRDNALRVKYSPSYMDYRYDKNGIAYDYSGLSAIFDGSDFEEAAHKLVKDIESKYVAETHDLWDATNAATKKILRDGYKAGMMSKDTYLYVRDMYSHYIPLRGWDGTTADQVWDYIGGGKGAFNQTLKTAHGRTSIADDPIAYIENMAESGILLNNKNWVKQHLMLLAQNHPTSLLTLSKAWYVKSTDANGNEEWIPATPQITSQMNSNQVKAAIDAFEKKMEKKAQTGDATQKRDGLNIAYPQTHSEEREHEVRVMKDGEEYVIYVNGDPQLAQAMNNTRAHRVREIQSGKLDRAAAWLGRKMAAAYTSLSPLFIPSNYFRDLTMTLASTAIREDAKYNYLLRKNLATSWNLGFMLRDYQNGKLRDKVSNGNATAKEQMFYDFMMNGGETGFVSSLDVEDLKKKFKNDLKDLDRWKANPVKVGHTIMDGIEFLNRAIEDSNRFAVYMTSIQYGRSIDEAVNDAKDVTLNFNRKGTGEYGWQMIRNLYLFINPAVQSLQTLGALVKHHPFKFTAVTASWLASGVLVPIVNAALMSMFGGDDDKDKYWQFTKWDRRNNLIMWVPFTHEYVKIPLAQEFRAFYGVGDMIASKMMGGELAEESWSQYGEDLLGQVVDMLPLDPTGYDGNIAVSLMPNAIRPVFELAFNVDFTGKPLFKDTEYNKYDPNFTKAYVGTPDWLVRASKMVNSIGNDYPDVQQNSIDAFGDPRYNLNNPAVVDHVLSSYLGGAYTMGSQVLGVLTKSLNDPKEIKVADIPLFSKFVSNPDDRPVTKKQGDEFWDMKENHDRAANTLSKLKKQAKVDGDYSMLERFYDSEEYKQYKQDDVKVKKYEEDKKKERAEESGEEYRPHKLNAEDIYKSHATPKDDFEDLKLKQLYTKLNGFKTSYDLLVDTAPSRSDGYYNTNKAAIDAIDEISLDKQEISELKKGFLDDGKDAYNAEDMKQIRELRKKILAVLEKANKVVVANQKAKAEK